MYPTTAPRNSAQLERYILRAAGDLDAASKNARTEDEREHALTGWRLCAALYGRLG